MIIERVGFILKEIKPILTIETHLSLNGVSASHLSCFVDITNTAPSIILQTTWDHHHHCYYVVACLFFVVSHLVPAASI